MTDNSKTYTSVIDNAVVSDNTDYIDINIYVTCPDGSEWRKTVSLNKRNGEIDDSVICYAESEDHSFDEATKSPPPVVTALFNECYEEAKQLLLAAYSRQTHVKDNAEDMLRVLKSAFVTLRDYPNAHDLKYLMEYVKHTLDRVEGGK